MNLEDFSKEELITALRKLEDKYPACYRSFVIHYLSPEWYEKIMKELHPNDPTPWIVNENSE